MTRMRIKLPKSVGDKNDFGHFWSLQQHTDSCVCLARYMTSYWCSAYRLLGAGSRERLIHSTLPGTEASVLCTVRFLVSFCYYLFAFVFF